MSDLDRDTGEFAERLLEPLREPELEVPEDLPSRTIRRVWNLIAMRDAVDFVANGFVRGFLAPLVERAAAILAHRSTRGPANGPAGLGTRDRLQPPGN